MVLRIPSTVTDISLLEDEPFKTHFDKRQPAREGRNCKQQRAPFYVKLEQCMREEPGGLDAADAWLKTVFSPGRATLDSAQIDAFVKFFWLLYSDNIHSAMAYMCSEAKALGCETMADKSTSITGSTATLTKRKARGRRRRSKRARAVDAYDGEIEDNNSLFPEAGFEQKLPVTAPAPRTVPLDSTVQQTCPSVSAGAGARRGKKRKAKKQQPSVNSQSSSSPSSSESPPLLVPAVPDKPYFPCVDSDSLTPVSSEVEDAPMALSLPSISAPVRSNPTRKAANREALAKMMQKETRWQAGRHVSSDDETEIQPSISAPLLAKAKTGSNSKKNGKARKKACADDDATNLPGSGTDPSQPPAADSASVAIPVPSVKQTSAAVGRRAATSQGARKKQNVAKASNKNKRVAGQPLPLCKKHKLSDGTAGSLATVFMPQLAGVSASAPLPSRGAGPSPVIESGPAVEHADGPSKKRTLQEMESESAPVPARIPVKRTSARLRRALPTNKKPASQSEQQSLPAPAEDTLGDSASTVDAIVREAGAIAQAVLACTDEVASEWEARNPDEEQLAESSDEDIPLSAAPAVRRPSKCQKQSLKLRIPGTRQSEPRSPALPRTRKERMYPIVQGPGLTTASVPIPVIGTAASVAVPTVAPAGPSTIPLAMPSAIPAEPVLPQCKLPLPEYPPIWAQSRQEVCETFEPFRSYQGGVYFSKNVAKGYLLSAFSANRDVFHDGGKLIVSHGGGKAESLHKANGRLETFEASDQQEGDKSVRALLETQRMQYPIALLIDDKYALFPYDLASKGCTYAVLGWYYIAHAWAEYQPATNTQGKVVRYKFAFRWCDGQGEPWWHKFGSLGASTVIDQNVFASINTKCPSCKVSSPQVYVEGWMCLSANCSKFWETAGAAVPAQLTYAESFLNCQKPFTQALTDIRPACPVDAASFPADHPTTSEHFSKGWHCPKCGRLSSRFKWEHWECRNCGETFDVKGRPRTAQEFRMQVHAKTFDRWKPHMATLKPILKTFKGDKAHGTHTTFILPHNRGRIHLISPSPLDTDHANKILLEYQEQARSGQLQFRRWPMRSHKCRGTLLTNYFSQNTGEPYQYVGGDVNTVKFSEAPSAVLQALEMINLRMEQASLVPPGFNEVLTAAYMEKQKMAFHSDSERGLGPVVASLSLGASAIMHFRLHAHFSSELEQGSSRDMLDLYLRHITKGDVLVMEGAGIQDYYEHTVVPQNFRIAATARFIGGSHR